MASVIFNLLDFSFLVIMKFISIIPYNPTCKNKIAWINKYPGYLLHYMCSTY